MKRQIRRGVFETNSSSVHSLTMCSDDEYQKWENGDILFWGDKNKFATRDEIISEIKKIRAKYGFEDDWENEEEVCELLSDHNVKTYDEFWDHYDCEYETFEEEYVTPSGEKVIAFGYYGNDY